MKVLDWRKDVINPFINNGGRDLQKILDSDSIKPNKENIFRAFKLTPYEKVRVVILGQDPYPGDGVADGLAFSASDNVKTPKSLQNIFKKISMDFGIINQNKFFPSNRLTNWANSGILLLNTTLTFERGKSKYHKKVWNGFTESVLKAINNHPERILVILWGNHAQNYSKYLTSDRHIVLKSVHPSPLSAYKGFFEVDHFIRINEHLGENFSFSTGKSTI